MVLIQKNLEVFCCSANSTSKPKSFQTEVNYSLSFLKGTTFNYFEPYLTDYSVNEHVWLNDYELFVEELLINFSPYNMMAHAEVELEQLIMKDNHKTTKFFVDSTDLPCFFSTMVKPSTEEHTSLSRRGSRMKWYISTNLTHSTDSGTSFRKLTNAIGNEKANFCKRSRSLPSKI